MPWPMFESGRSDDENEDCLWTTPLRMRGLHFGPLASFLKSVSLVWTVRGTSTVQPSNGLVV
jgi:hypothetical protein